MSRALDHARPAGRMGGSHRSRDIGRGTYSPSIVIACGAAWSPRSTAAKSNVVRVIASGPSTSPSIARSYAGPNPASGWWARAAM